MNEYEKQAQDFLNETNSTIEWELKGLTNRLGGKKTLEYEFKIKRGNRHYIGSFNSSLNDLHKVLKFEENRINPNCLLAESITNEFGVQLNSKRKTNEFCVQLNSKRKKILIYKEGTFTIVTVDRIPIPSAYDLLACIQCYDVGTLQDFIDEYGCDANDIEKTLSTYEAVKEESEAMKMLYNDDELEKLQEIA